MLNVIPFILLARTNSGIVSGIVRDENDHGASAVKIALKGTTYDGAITDSEGRFEIKKCRKALRINSLWKNLFCKAGLI